jgi:hypothetical protein
MLRALDLQFTTQIELEMQREDSSSPLTVPPLLVHTCRTTLCLEWSRCRCNVKVQYHRVWLAACLLFACRPYSMLLTAN